MQPSFKIDIPNKFSAKEKEMFLKLLIKQGQVDEPSLGKINSSALICIAYYNDEPVGIGAIKQVYKTPFDKAEIGNLKSQFDNELGYLFVDNDPAKELRGKGIGQSICNGLLEKLGNTNIFATTEDTDDNPMKHILMKCGFIKAGKTYIGSKTKKRIGLFIKTKR